MVERIDAFDETLRAQTSPLVKETVKRALINCQADQYGIVRNGGKRHQKASLCAFGVIFRAPKVEPQTRHHMHIGRKELLTEISPGVKAPYYLKARVITGE